MLHAKNECLKIDDGTMDYIKFGNGNKNLIMIPGVGDGLKTVKGMALPFAFLYRRLSRDFTVYVFSRRNDLKKHTTTRMMAEDMNKAIELLQLAPAAIVGVSQGGMIAQWLAIDHPDKVDRLVLTVTLSRPNKIIQRNVDRWIRMAYEGDYKGIMLDTAKRSYSPKRKKKALRMYSMLGNFGKPKSFERFIIQAEACKTHNSFKYLSEISCPTLIIGGTDDGIVTGDASEEMEEQIKNSKLCMYKGLSHGLYEEAPDFLSRVKDFCM